MARNRINTNSTESTISRYTQGGLTDRYQTRLGWWERFVIEKQPDDIRFIISSEYEARPDLVAYQLYRRATLQWLVLQYNNIVDINTEFVSGKIILLPTPQRVQVSILANITGGRLIK